MGGVITDISAAAKKITIKQHQVKRERIVTLMMSGKTAKELSDLKVGDSVNVWVRGKADHRFAEGFLRRTRVNFISSPLEKQYPRISAIRASASADREER